MLLLQLLAVSAFSQSRKLRGKVLDEESGKGIPGAQVAFPSERKAVFSDSSGSFMLQVNADTGSIRISFPAFEPRFFRIEKWPAGNLSIRLKSKSLEEVTIEGSGRPEDKVASTQMSVEKLSSKEARLLPALFGEVDLIKTLQL